MLECNSGCDWESMFGVRYAGRTKELNACFPLSSIVAGSNVDVGVCVGILGTSHCSKDFFKILSQLLSTQFSPTNSTLCIALHALDACCLLFVCSLSRRGVCGHELN